MATDLAAAKDFTGARGRILVVDDDAAYRRLLFERLLEAGHDVFVEKDGASALKRLDDDPPELIVCDWMMPGMDGFEVCRLVKQDPATESIYFILFTSNDSIEDKVSALDMGADDYLVKGCSYNELAARVRTGLRIHRLHRHLEEVSYTDALTGLRNRRYYDQRLQEEVARCRRHYTPMSLVLIDLDRFKEINDQYGHPTGDRVLETVAAALCKRVRTSEVACRIGGDEFAIILANTAGEGARVLARALEDLLSGLSVQVEGGVELRISGSAGWAELGPGMDAEAVFRATDETLYARKDERRKVNA
jgi:diguanylate cyclase (GGDEF)-like protein